jgi:hypothetical protein
MTQSCMPSWLRQTALTGALGLALLTVGAPDAARAQDDSGENNAIANFERKIWGGFIRGLGLRSGDDPVIEYRERSPLVIPPSRDLPQPQGKSAATNPAWPTDPDANRRKQRTDSKRTVGNDTSRVLDRQSSPMNPSDLNAQGGTPSTASGPPRGDVSGDGQNLNPNELGYFGGLLTGRGFGFGGYRDETGTFTNEPPRSALTAPPPGYQTPSQQQPYGVTRRIERSAPEQFDPAGRM